MVTFTFFKKSNFNNLLVVLSIKYVIFKFGNFSANSIKYLVNCIISPIPCSPETKRCLHSDFKSQSGIDFGSVYL